MRGAGTYRGVWPLFAGLMAAVLASAACVLWFMTQAMASERLAVRQRLAETCTRQLEAAAMALETYWQGRLDGLDPAPQFHHLITDGEWPSALLLAPDGPLRYPTETVRGAPPSGEAWERALRLEFRARDYAAAAEAYHAFARDADALAGAVRGLTAAARCRAKAGNRDGALALLDELDGVLPLTAERPDAYAAYLDARLYALELGASGAADLAVRVCTYDGPPIAAAQRLFLMQRLAAIAPDTIAPRLIEAESLALMAVESGTIAPKPGAIAPVVSGRLYGVTARSGEAMGLVPWDAVEHTAADALAAHFTVPGVAAELHPPGAAPVASPFAAHPLGASLEGWSWVATVTDAALDAAAGRQAAAYALAGGFGIGAIVAAFSLVGFVMVRQARLTGLKNELIATVSHELKTPLAAARVLLDTLLAGRCQGEAQQREYLELIAQENARLSRLIDNFLTFSRMERRKQVFDMRPMDLADAAQNAVAALGDRLAAPHTTYAMHLVPARVRGDGDALTTVILNLLDNALKYTGEMKHIRLELERNGSHIELRIHDNGAGLSRRAARRVFDPFYQADRRLSRDAGGCGLGLAIVRFIVEAHGGTVTAGGVPGVGSTFTVRLPALAGPEEPA